MFFKSFTVDIEMRPSLSKKACLHRLALHSADGNLPRWNWWGNCNLNSWPNLVLLYNNVIKKA